LVNCTRVSSAARSFCGDACEASESVDTFQFALLWLSSALWLLWGIVGSPTCVKWGGLDLQAKVDNVVVAGLGSDSSNNQIQAVDRLFAFSANGDGGPFCGNMRSKGDSYDDWSSIAPPKFDVTMDNWFLCGEDGADGTCPASPSSICNYVGNHDGDWKIEGGDPDSDHNCQFKSPFPWKF